jgi:hypothetical protein
MPPIQRQNIPPRLLDHLADRVMRRQITRLDIEQLAHWLDSQPEVPSGEWFKRFGNFTVCGHGSLVTTFLTSKQSAIGIEVE